MLNIFTQCRTAQPPPEPREDMTVLVSDRQAGRMWAMSWRDYCRDYLRGSTKLKRRAKRRNPRYVRPT